MKFIETGFRDLFIVELNRIEDERGFFARSWCDREFESRGLASRMVQANLAFSPRTGTLRGLHYQVSPHAEAKLIRCTQGRLFDVAVDLRPDSNTFRRWFSLELSADNHRMLYIPEAFAHGYQTLTSNSELLYQTSQFFHPESAKGFRFDDPAFGICWPVEVRCISEKDRTLPDFGHK